MVKTSADSLLRVINDILDFSRIEAGKLELDQVDYRSQTGGFDTCRGLAFRAHEKKLELVCEIATAVPPLVSGDPFRLRQILVNLIGNAIKFTEQGEVEIRCGVQPALSGGVACGLPCATPESEFRRKAERDFLSVHPSRRFHYQAIRGNGFGVDDLGTVCSHDGRAHLDRKQAARGDGLSFHGCPSGSAGPRNTGRTRGAARRVSCGPPGIGCGRQSDQLRMLKASLREFGMTVTTADRGQIALDLFKKTVTTGTLPELLLLDVQMPDMDGFTLAERFQEHSASPRPAIMMLCSVDLAADASRCREMGIAAYLMKPVGRVELKEAITRVLGSDSAKPQQRALVAQEPRTASPRETYIFSSPKTMS